MARSRSPAGSRWRRLRTYATSFPTLLSSILRRLELSESLSACESSGPDIGACSDRRAKRGVNSWNNSGGYAVRGREHATCARPHAPMYPDAPLTACLPRVPVHASQRPFMGPCTYPLGYPAYGRTIYYKVELLIYKSREREFEEPVTYGAFHRAVPDEDLVRIDLERVRVRAHGS